jgi:hypothetical protein
VRGDLVKDSFFAAGFADESDPTLGEVAQTAVEKAGGFAGGAGGEIVLFDEGGAQAAHGRVARDAGADDAAADDEDVEGDGNEIGENLGAGQGLAGSFKFCGVSCVLHGRIALVSDLGI